MTMNIITVWKPNAIYVKREITSTHTGKKVPTNSKAAKQALAPSLKKPIIF